MSNGLGHEQVTKNEYNAVNNITLPSLGEEDTMRHKEGTPLKWQEIKSKIVNTAERNRMSEEFFTSRTRYREDLTWEYL